MRRFAFSTIVAGMILAAAAPHAQAALPSEKALRDRVAQFYGLLVEAKYRQTEPLVYPSDRDSYYASEKPVIRDYKVKSIEWGPDHKTAEISMVSRTLLRKARIGEFEVDFPYMSHWKFEKGQWWWYLPEVSKRATPFGEMPIEPKTGAGEGINLHDMISKAPKPADLQNGVSADRKLIALIDSSGFRAVVKLQNKLPGTVQLELSAVDSKVFTAKLNSLELKQGDTAELEVERVKPGPADQPTISVLVKPTQQKLVFHVR